MRYLFDQKPNTNLSENAQSALDVIRSSEYAVLVGRNNCGKTFLLKSLTHSLGESASYLGPQRYQNFSTLGYYTPNRNKKQQKWRDFNQQWQSQSQNIDNSPLSLQQAIAELGDKQRDKLIEIIEVLLNTKLEILHTVSDNSMSQKYISCNGHNISFTSSGFRLITTLVTCLLDEDYEFFLIDEPELGISPEAQGVLADFLFDKAHRAKYFPHIKTIILATHSTIFLDRLNIKNNFIVEKNGNTIDIKHVSNQLDFNKIHFFLLGNRFETLYLPSAIILVEGKTDQKYLSKILDIEFPGVQFSVINATSDSRMKEILHIAKDLFSDIQKSPYRDRVIAVLDKVHGKDIISSIKDMGFKAENILVWDENGIEYYYPTAIINTIFSSSDPIQIKDDNVECNGISYKKAELVEKVLIHLDEHVVYPEEFKKKFLNKIEAITGLMSSSKEYLFAGK